ncbi:MAG: DUF4861 domain-containing protein, partial [Hymenobacter sp.]
MKTLLLALPLAALGLGALPAAPPAATITVRNKLNLARHAETISLPLAQLPVAVRGLRAASLRVRNASKQLLVSQLLDNNGDGQPDELLFQTDVPAQGTQTFSVAAGTEALPAAQQRHGLLAQARGLPHHRQVVWPARALNAFRLPHRHRRGLRPLPRGH